jgi:hypothetical protein
MKISLLFFTSVFSAATEKTSAFPPDMVRTYDFVKSLSVQRNDDNTIKIEFDVHINLILEL